MLFFWDLDQMTKAVQWRQKSPFPRVVFVLLLVIGPEYKLNLDAIVSPLQEKKKKKKRAP